ncbi:MAG: SGNH/GDSL hydrolase family protein, partial [Bacteroidaceae bacterium]|nr:SGNH/GDSL hydrolase family protein [Bacteroidaceae bacterium]
MRKTYLAILVFVFAFCMAQAQQTSKSVTIFGDSYSTFEGYLMPENNLTWYFLDRQVKDNDVVAVEQTWWHQLLKKNGWRLCMNNSYSGSTIS